MTKTWNGPTPYDPQTNRDVRYSTPELWVMAEVYRAAMNSPEVRIAMSALRHQLYPPITGEANPLLRIQQEKALAAYEAGLRETP